MSFNIPSIAVTVTKLTAGGNFLFVFSDADGPIAPNATGTIGSSKGKVRFVASILSADMATFAALGGGSSATRFYAPDGATANQGDYPQSVIEGA